MLRGDLPRLARATNIVTASAGSPNKRSKPLKYAYEKEIVLYAHHKKLDYFSTECIYSPEAFRGSARTLIKNLERIRPSAILDVVKSGEDMATLVPPELAGSSGCQGRGRPPLEADDGGEDGSGACGSTNGRSSGGEMAAMEKRLAENDRAAGAEMEVTSASIADAVRAPPKADTGATTDDPQGQATNSPQGQPHDRSPVSHMTVGPVKRRPGRKVATGPRMGQCTRCGYLSSQPVCKACTLLEGLNKNRPRVHIELGADEEDASGSLRRGVERMILAGE